MSSEVKNTEFVQLCVMTATTLGESTPEEFESFFESKGFRIKFAEEVITLPDKENGKDVEGTGGRHDIFFYIHSEDIGKFAIPRLSMGIRWWEDVIANGNSGWYSKEILEKYPTTW